MCDNITWAQDDDPLTKVPEDNRCPEFVPLVQARERLGLRIDEVAELVGVDAREYEQLERHPANHDFASVLLAGLKLGVDRSEFIQELQSYCEELKRLGLVSLVTE